MAITAETRRLVDDLRDSLGRIVDAATDDTTERWLDAWDEVSDELLSALLELASADELTRARLIRSARLQNALQLIGHVLDRLAAETGVRMAADLDRIVQQAGQAQAAIIASQLPPESSLVDVQAWSRVDPLQVAAIVERATQRITSPSKPLNDTAYQAVVRSLLRGVPSGDNPNEVARRMVARARYGFNGGLARAVNIARTEMLTAHREAARLGRLQNADVVKGWRWIASLDRRTCPACLLKNGSTHATGEPGPDGHQSCRCAAAPITRSWRDLGLDIDEPEDEFPDAEAWFWSQTPATQRHIMGGHRLALLKAGRAHWSDLATLKHNSEWRDSWVVTPIRNLAA